MALLERVLCVKPSPPQWEDPKYMPFTNPIRHEMVRWVSAHLKTHAFSLDIGVGDTAAQLDELNTMSLIGP